MNIDQEIARLNVELQKNPDNERAKKAKAICLNNKALALNSKGKHEDALKFVKQAIQLDPAHAAFYCNQALFYSKNNKYNDAIEAASKALELEPHNHNAIETLSLNLNNQFAIDCQKGNDQEALKKIDRAIELKPHEKMFYYNKATILNKLTRYEEADEVIDKALEIDSSCANARLMKSIVLNQLSLVDSNKGNYEDALKKINKAIELKSNEIAYFINKGSYLISLNLLDEATEIVDKALNMDKNNKDVKRLKDILEKRK